jgi:ApbE superfamily uncharacterized protein (UPF0280 family)
MTALAAVLPDGRLHLQHGPIDCLCRAWGEPDQVARAYAQASEAFPAILPTLCAELPALRTPLPSLPPSGDIARAMHAACAPFADRFVTPMAAVAGAVADHVLAAMLRGTHLARAFVNDGGDIAFHLSPGETLRCGMVADLAAPALDAVVTLTAEQPARGIATSGRACKGQGGRSFSFAASIIANAVDLPGHPAIVRRPAIDIDPDSDLGARAVTWNVLALSAQDVDAALDAGCAEAEGLRRAGLIAGAALSLGGRIRLALAPSLAGTLS